MMPSSIKLLNVFFFCDGRNRVAIALPVLTFRWVPAILRVSQLHLFFFFGTLLLFSIILAAKSADPVCYDKLNTEAAGYGTCDPATNSSCAAR